MTTTPPKRPWAERLARLQAFPKVCPLCKSAMVIIGQGPEPMTSRLYIEPLDSRAEGQAIAGANILVGYSSCSRCGFLALFNLTQLGIDPVRQAPL